MVKQPPTPRNADNILHRYKDNLFFSSAKYFDHISCIIAVISAKAIAY